MVPKWAATSNDRPWSGQPRKYGTRMRWPDELIGRNSVTAWTSDRTTAWNGVKVASWGWRGRDHSGTTVARRRLYILPAGRRPPAAGDTAPPRRAAPRRRALFMSGGGVTG